MTKQRNNYGFVTQTILSCRLIQKADFNNMYCRKQRYEVALKTGFNRKFITSPDKR